MNIKQISIKEDSTTIKASTKAGTTIAITSDQIHRQEMGQALRCLAKIAADVLKHDVDLMQVRSIAITENKKGVQFVKLGGVLAAVSKDGQAKPGKFSTSKIEITLMINPLINELEKEAQAFMQEAMR